MDASLTGGLPVTLIGIGTVFAALLSLICAVMVMTWVTSRGAAQAERVSEAPQTSPAAEVTAAGERPDLARVAVAAYALHLQIRGRASSGAEAPGGSRWALAGRTQQLTPLSR